MSRALIVLTAADSLALADGSDHPTGFWAEEFVAAHRGLIDAGVDVVVATPGGAPAPVDPASVTATGVGDAEKARDLRGYLDRVGDVVAHPAVLEEQEASAFDAIVLPGGHGPMTDLASNPALGSLLAAANRAGAVIAPFCHGPAGLLSATDAEGTFVFAGRRMTAFTDGEERQGGLGEATPWWLATRLAERGAVVEAGEAWSSTVVVDGNLISGQNPQSSDAVTRAVVDALAAR